MFIGARLSGLPTMKIFDRFLHNDSSRVRKTRYCRTCGNPTQKSKIVCTNHIDELPYVQEVLKRIEDHKKAQLVKKVKVGSVIYREIFSYIYFKQCDSYKRMIKHLNLRSEVVEMYIDYFVKEGMCRLTEEKGTRKLIITYINKRRSP